MKKIKTFTGLAFIAFIMFACTLDYNLQFAVTSYNYDSSTGICSVHYTIQNTGHKTLHNIHLGIEVSYKNSYGVSQKGTSTASCGDLSVLESKSLYEDIDIGFGCTDISAIITSAGWNDTDDNENISF